MLYKLNTNEVKSSSRIKIGAPADFDLTEKDIENFLKSRLHEVVSEDQLMLIGQERRRQEEADLLALDKEGQLYIFELKRWQSNVENILQVMRYAQIFGRYTYLELEDLARRQYRFEGKLKSKHKEFFELDNELSDSDFNREQILVLVTNGTDRDTISAVNFWSQKGVKIKCSPYRIYDIENQPYIQFDTYSPDEEIIPEVNTKLFIVNTNKTYMPDIWMDMLSNSKAAAYYERKTAVCSIPRGAVVYLYHTAVGAIAKGVATAGYQIKDFEGDEQEEYYVPLKLEWALSDENQWYAKAPAAREINRELNSGYRFRQTSFQISQDMADAIDRIAERKRGAVV